MVSLSSSPKRSARMDKRIPQAPAVAGPSTRPMSRPRSSLTDQFSPGSRHSFHGEHSTDFPQNLASHRSTIWSATGDLSPGDGDSILQDNLIPPTLYVPTPNHSPTIQPSRHPEFWLYDGSIVLSVQNTLFRVHQTILANHSEVFSDLFTVPQPEGEETMDGCHLVHLQDSAKDFEDLLRAVYIPDHFESVTVESDLESILTFITGILRLSTKYMIRYLRQRCITLFLAKLPSTFAGYEAKSLSTTPDRYRSDTIMRAIQLARETNVPEAIPYAYYCLSRFPHKRFLKDRPDDISWKDKMIVLIGRERLQWAQMSLSHRFLLVFQRSPVCVSAMCAHSRGPHAEWHEIERLGSAHPLRAYEGWDNMNVCKDCISYCQARHLEGRKEVWKCLPTWFELPTWEELKAAQNS
ncbi:hypothetical protein JR316_0012053 [Psilocybe cubensis]|uniref:BTB domain-containing protein n=2 Tax=Psilocybe cubensis TaxID=181762 RepID=A0A8H7XRB0_PSICU|nr:hypothetical protein JR316_0012053 [Psilocybe cubensis]KAH9474954.1 hypothetical protein JR316_0012053 [Psilocybe cubensis]